MRSVELVELTAHCYRGAKTLRTKPVDKRAHPYRFEVYGYASDPPGRLSVDKNCPVVLLAWGTCIREIARSEILHAIIQVDELKRPTLSISLIDRKTKAEIEHFDR